MRVPLSHVTLLVDTPDLTYHEMLSILCRDGQYRPYFTWDSFKNGILMRLEIVVVANEVKRTVSQAAYWCKDMNVNQAKDAVIDIVLTQMGFDTSKAKVSTFPNPVRTGASSRFARYEGGGREGGSAGDADESWASEKDRGDSHPSQGNVVWRKAPPAAADSDRSKPADVEEIEVPVGESDSLTVGTAKPDLSAGSASSADPDRSTVSTESAASVNARLVSQGLEKGKQPADPDDVDGGEGGFKTIVRKRPPIKNTRVAKISQPQPNRRQWGDEDEDDASAT